MASAMLIMRSLKQSLSENTRACCEVDPIYWRSRYGLGGLTAPLQARAESTVLRAGSRRHEGVAYHLHATINRFTILANVEGRTPRVDRHLMSTGAVAQRRKVHLTALGWLSIRVGLHAAAQLFPYLMEARLRGAQLYSQGVSRFSRHGRDRAVVRSVLVLIERLLGGAQLFLKFAQFVRVDVADRPRSSPASVQCRMLNPCAEVVTGARSLA